DPDALLDLLARDRQRRAHHDHVPVRHEIEAALERRLRDPADRGEYLAGGVEGNERLARGSILHELDAPEAAETAHVADRGMPLLQAAQRRREDAAHLG